MGKAARTLLSAGIVGRWKTLFAVYCGLILYVSSWEVVPRGISPGFSDKTLHFGEYFVLGLLAWRAFASARGAFPWGLVAFGACFGIADECWQDWLDHARTPDVWDAAADAVGAFTALVLCQVFWKR